MYLHYCFSVFRISLLVQFRVTSQLASQPKYSALSVSSWLQILYRRFVVLVYIVTSCLHVVYTLSIVYVYLASRCLRCLYVCCLYSFSSCLHPVYTRPVSVVCRVWPRDEVTRNQGILGDTRPALRAHLYLKHKDSRRAVSLFMVQQRL